MKNLKHEVNRLSAIRQLTSGNITGHRTLTNGVYVPHLYEEPYAKLAYWSDFSFRLNRQWISVAWTHPRMALLDHISNMAHAEADKLAPFQHQDFLADMTPNYVKVGNSRKKHTTSTWNPSTDNEAYFNNYRESRLKILKGEQGMDISVPSTHFSIQQMAYGKFVSITTPVELVKQEDIVQYALNVKAHLKSEINLMVQPNHLYTLADYHQDLADVGEEIQE